MTHDSALRIILFREERFWLAQGLEHDICVQADNLKELMVRLDLLLRLEGAALWELPPAPKYFHDLWTLKAGLFLPEGELSTVRAEFGVVA